VSRQLQDCRTLVTRHRWGPAHEFVDNDVSAFDGKRRAAYSKLLSAVKAGDVNRIVVYHADRLYRKPRELEDLVDLADQGRVQVASVHSGELNLGNSDGRLVARMLIAVAAKESEDKSRRVKRAKQQAREEGKPGGGPRPFGWRDLTNPEPKESALVVQAIDTLLAGASLGDVARRWNAAGVPQPQTGRPNWTADGVRQVVSNPRHAALIGVRVEQRPDGAQRRYARPVVIGKAKWAPIIDRTRWERLQALLQQRGASGRVPRRRSLLTGLVTCGGCGATMSRTGGPRRIWRCPWSPQGRSCGGVSIDAERLEYLLTEATLKRADTASLATVVRQHGRHGKDAADLVRQLEELERRLDKAAESYAGGRLDARAFERASATIQREQHELQGRLGRLTSMTALEPYAGRLGVLRSAWPTLSVDQQRAIIGIVLGRVTIKPAAHPGRTFDPDRVQIAARR